MLDVSNPQQNAFREAPGSDTAQLVPMHSFPPLAGGLAYVRVGARFPFGHRQALVVRDLDLLLRDRDLASLKLTARCLGMRTGPAIKPCTHTAIADSFDALKAGHPSLYELKERHEVHIFALYSDETMIDARFDEVLRQYNERIEELTELAKAKRYSEAQALRAQLGWGTRPPEPPKRDLVGLCIPTAMSGGWDHVHPERAAM